MNTVAARPILITGASGLLGRALFAELRSVGMDVRGTAYRRVGPGLDRVDVCDTSALGRYLDELRPGVIIHAAAERRPDFSEKDPAGTQRLNVEATGVLAEAAKSLGAWLLYISTDYVFDGINPPYRPDAAMNPVNIYGRSKRDGELAVRRVLSNHIILRVPILYGAVETLEESPLTTIVAELLRRRGEKVEMDDWAVRYPTLTNDVGVVCRRIVEYKGRCPDFAGTFHWSGDEPMTRHGMACRMASLIGFSCDDIVPRSSPSGGAVRPRDCCLDCSDLEALGVGCRTSFAAAIPGILASHIPVVC